MALNVPISVSRIQLEQKNDTKMAQRDCLFLPPRMPETAAQLKPVRAEEKDKILRRSEVFSAISAGPKMSSNRNAETC